MSRRIPAMPLLAGRFGRVQILVLVLMLSAIGARIWMIKLSIARTVWRVILHLLPALILISAFLSLGSLVLAASVSAEQRDSADLFSDIAAVSFVQPTQDQPETDENLSDTGDTETVAYPVGIFITSLHDLDLIGGSFGVDYWVWSVHPPELDPLENLELYNAEEADAELDLKAERGDQEWSQRKVSAVVRHDWDLSNFPFDRQVLDIVLEEGAADITTLVYSADAGNSGYNEDIVLEGWRVTDFAIEERTVDYPTTFGDPDISSGSSYARLVASIQIEREGATGFFKLVAGVYAASAIGLLSFLMVPHIAPIFGARMVVLVGSLFATVISLRASEAVLGSSESLSLLDKIHIVAMVYIFIAALIAVFARKTCESGKEDLAKRRDRTWLRVLGISFVLVNALLISTAAIVG